MKPVIDSATTNTKKDHRADEGSHKNDSSAKSNRNCDGNENTSSTIHTNITRIGRCDTDLGPNDVVCARGKGFWDHEGNKRYRALIQAATGKYSASRNKLEKTYVVTEILKAIEEKNGRFVKKEIKGGPWVVVSDTFAREKVGQSFRDGLHGKYKSSTKAKKERRAAANEKFHDDIESAIFQNRVVSQRIGELNHEVKQSGATASDYSMMSLFTRANSDILENIKNDKRMMAKYQEASNAANSEG